MALIHRAGAALAAAALLGTGPTGPATAALNPLIDDERAATRVEVSSATANGSFTAPEFQLREFGTS